MRFSHVLPVLVLIVALTAHALANPRISSWFTDLSGKYARLYETTDDESARNSVTTWSRGQGVQTQPTYAGIHEISSDATRVYIRTTGLAGYAMGPWYLNAAKTNLFPNYPANRAVLYRLPLDPGTPPVVKSLTGLGAIGYFVDGVAMFDSRDAFSYVNSAGVDASPPNGLGNGDLIWNRDAYVNESVTFDAGNAHQAGSQYHYHANPPGLRHLLGDSVDYDPVANTYIENFNGQHSPIIGWVRDSYPVYGPYGYDDPNDPGSGVVRMSSGYQKRSITVRQTLPAWAVRTQGIGPALAPNQYGPNVTAGADSQYELGHYLEDYDYKGDLGLAHGVDFDLDEHNGRFCVTPEFPGGTYAYFTSIEADGTPVYPYNIGRTYYGNPTGTANPAGGIPAGATVHFEGGPEVREGLASISVDDSNGDVELVFNTAEGGSYAVEATDDLELWGPVTSFKARSDLTSIPDPGRANRADRQFYRVLRTDLDPFDDDGFDYDNSPPDLGLFAATFPTNPALPLQGGVTSITIGGLPATILSYDQSTGLVGLDFDYNALPPGSYGAVLTYTPSGGTETMISSTNRYEIPPRPNILLLIVDDWGIDASPLDNPGGVVASMPNLAALAAGGLRFTNAYAQPTCSPTRATLMTGRHPHQTTVFTPGQAGNFSESETTLPEAFAASGSPYALASMGKWHLGGGDDGYSLRGGWPEFYGITGGGVPENVTPNGYANWTKNTNGSPAPTTTYSTTDQVNEAVAFINRSETAGVPWFTWVAFNAPHTPFHDPAALVPSDPDLVPPGGYSAQLGDNANQWNYRKMLETLDQELGRLLASVDQSVTNIILVGDNGTPAQVVQAPFGPRGAGAAAHAKGDLYEGGVHVPMLVKGPAVTITPGTTTNKLVHVIDLFSTILELAGINPASVAPADAVAQSNSILPILTGTDTADRCIVCENPTGRTIIVDDYPDYKLIINGDPLDLSDTPTFEFYNIALDPNEQSLLNLGSLSGLDFDAYNACMAKDAALGGGFSDPPSAVGDTLYLELPNITGPASPPNNQNVLPTLITINDGTGTNQTANFVARVDQSETVMRYWVKCTLPPGISGPYSNAVVTFPENPNNGAPRVFTAIQIVGP